MIDSQTSYSISIWSRDEFYLEDSGKFVLDKFGIQVRDIDEILPAQVANSWAVLFK
jgi:hypothetical protein